VVGSESHIFDTGIPPAYNNWVIGKSDPKTPLWAGLAKDRGKNNFAVLFANHPTECDGYFGVAEVIFPAILSLDVS
jgi:hypothetical protein